MTKPRKMGRKRATKAKPSPLSTWRDAFCPLPTPSALAERFGCSRQTVYGLLAGDRKPSGALAAAIHVATNGAVPAEAWWPRRKRA